MTRCPEAQMPRCPEAHLSRTTLYGTSNDDFISREKRNFSTNKSSPKPLEKVLEEEKSEISSDLSSLTSDESFQKRRLKTVTELDENVEEQDEKTLENKTEEDHIDHCHFEENDENEENEENFNFPAPPPIEIFNHSLSMEKSSPNTPCLPPPLPTYTTVPELLHSFDQSVDQSCEKTDNSVPDFMSASPIRKEILSRNASTLDIVLSAFSESFSSVDGDELVDRNRVPEPRVPEPYGIMVQSSRQRDRNVTGSSGNSFNYGDANVKIIHLPSIATKPPTGPTLKRRSISKSPVRDTDRDADRIYVRKRSTSLTKRGSFSGTSISDTNTLEPEKQALDQSQLSCSTDPYPDYNHQEELELRKKNLPPAVKIFRQNNSKCQNRKKTPNPNVVTSTGRSWTKK